VSEKEQALPNAPVYEIQGRQVSLPVEVRDASSGNAMYMVDAAAAQALIPGDAFQVVESAPGQTQLLLGVIDYRDNDLGDYNEVAIIFFVHPRGGSAEQAGTYIYKLPVNQSFTCDAGCTIWGFPKTVDTIDYSYDDAKATCRLEMDGQHVFTLSLPRGSAAGGAAGDTAGPTYTYITGVPHRTTFTTGGDTVVSPGDDGIELSLGSHPIADELRGLGLPKPALMSTWNEHMRGTFEVPEKLA
jgi:hypothetical protein